MLLAYTIFLSFYVISCSLVEKKTQFFAILVNNSPENLHLLTFETKKVASIFIVSGIFQRYFYCIRYVRDIFIEVNINADWVYHA